MAAWMPQMRPTFGMARKIAYNPAACVSALHQLSIMMPMGRPGADLISSCRTQRLRWLACVVDAVLSGPLPATQQRDRHTSVNFACSNPVECIELDCGLHYLQHDKAKILMLCCRPRSIAGAVHLPECWSKSVVHSALYLNSPWCAWAPFAGDF